MTPADDTRDNGLHAQGDAPSPDPSRRGAGGGHRTPGEPPQGPEDDDRRKDASRRAKHVVAYVVVALLALYLFQQFLLGPLTSQSTQLDYSEFKTKLAGGQILHRCH